MEGRGDSNTMDTSCSSEGDILGPSDVSEDDDEDMITLTAQEILVRLERGWINEKLAPELLPPLTDEKDVMIRHVRIMEKNMLKLDKTDVRTGIHQLELERIRFVLVSYMRIRLFKIQEQSRYLLETEMKRSRDGYSALMPQELKFLKSFVSSTNEYMKTVVASNFPQPLQKLDSKKYLTLPQMDAFVFFRATDSENIFVDDADGQQYTVALQEGDQHIMRYAPISFLVKSGTANLV